MILYSTNCLTRYSLEKLYRGLQIGLGISIGLIIAGLIALEVLDLVKNNKQENHYT